MEIRKKERLKEEKETKKKTHEQRQKQTEWKEYE
jgi:hypothetical protein